jgi:hypothetical protein
MTNVDARNTWSRAMAQLEARVLTPEGFADARPRLEEIREAKPTEAQEEAL